MKKEVEDKKEDLKVEFMYTTISEAKKELKKRWDNKELRKKVLEYIGEIPQPFKKEPRAVISRSIITPNQEFFYFLDLAKHSGLKPIGLEGVEDKFCTKNNDKVSLGKLTFLSCEGLKNSLNHDRCKKLNTSIFDLQMNDGKRFCDIKTLWGVNLIDFHHSMMELKGVKIETFDDFAWFKKRNKKSNPDQYYSYLFALFLCHGILFDNFHANGKEKDFTKDIILKNFQKIYKEFGIKPLITPLVPTEDERNTNYWNGYLG